MFKLNPPQILSLQKPDRNAPGKDKIFPKNCMQLIENFISVIAIYDTKS